MRQIERIRELICRDRELTEVSRAADVDTADETALLADLFEPVLQDEGRGGDDEVVADVQHCGARVMELLAGAEDRGVDGVVVVDGLE